jgi:hypothetical protein
MIDNGHHSSAAETAVDFLEGRVELDVYNAAEESELAAMFADRSDPMEVPADVAVEALRTVGDKYEREAPRRVPVAAVITSLHEALRLDDPASRVHAH